MFLDWHLATLPCMERRDSLLLYTAYFLIFITAFGMLFLLGNILQNQTKSSNALPTPAPLALIPLVGETAVSTSSGQAISTTSLPIQTAVPARFPKSTPSKQDKPCFPSPPVTISPSTKSPPPTTSSIPASFRLDKNSPSPTTSPHPPPQRHLPPASHQQQPMPPSLPRSTASHSTKSSSCRPLSWKTLA